MKRKKRTVRSKRKQDLDLESGFFAKVRKNAPIVIMIAAILGLVYAAYDYHSGIEDLKSQIDSSLRKADSLRYAGLFEEAIDEYEDILKIVSSKKFPEEYARTQNNLGTAYNGLAEVRDKENNLRKTINAYQEALKIYTVESYPIGYATIQNNLGTAYNDLAEVRDKEDNLRKAINAYQKALNIYTIKN